MRKKLTVLFLSILAAACMVSCGAGRESGEKSADISPELTYTGSMELLYAEKFAVDYYEGGYALITIRESEAKDSRFLVLPEGAEVPGELAEDIVILKQPIENVYLVASAVMDMFVSFDALDLIRFSALKPEGWYVEPARAAMEDGGILYAGKYSAPDYEKILSEGCGLAVENTMIYHTPEVKEQLEKFGIPVLVDYSSYEPEPLGRTEWVRLYGLLAGREEAAEEAFASEVEAFRSIEESSVEVNEESKESGKTVAFFYITTSGEANIRRPSDYLPKMIELAGGSYIFAGMDDGEDTASSTMSMQMEEFYAAAKDADYIIYNSTIDGELTSVEELLGKSALLANFKAVQEGKVFGTTKNLYQSSMELGTIMADMHKMLTGEDDFTYIYKLE